MGDVANQPPGAPVSALDRRWEAIERLSPDGLCVFGPDGSLERANPVAARHFGLPAMEPREQLALAHARCLCGGDGGPLPDELNPILQAAEEGLPLTDLLVSWRRPDGVVDQLLMSLEPVPLTTGDRPRREVVATVRSLADASTTSQQLSRLMSDTAQQRHLLHLVFDNVDSGIALVDHEDRLGLWNLPFERMWGLQPGEAGRITTDALIGKVRWDFTPEQRAAFDSAMAGARESIEPVSFAVETRSRAFHIYTCRLAGGRRLWAMRDLTERRRMVSELEAAKEQAEADRNLLQLVFTNVETAIIAVDPELRVAAHNPLFGRMWQLDEPYLRSRPDLVELSERLRDFLPAESQQPYLDGVAHLMRGGRAGSIEFETNDGRFMVVYVAPLGDGGWLFSFRDLTDRRALESSLAARNEDLALMLQEQRETLSKLAELNVRLEESDRLKSEFLANTSHELRTPLNSILGYLGLIMDRLYADEDELLQFANTAYRSADHLLAVINDLLDIARIESGRVEVALEPVVLWLALDEVCESVRPQVAHKQLRLALPVQDLTLMARADPARLRQVLVNVLGNAVKFTQSGSVVVDMGGGDDRVWIQVRDTGIGIPPDKLQAVFDKFVQADGSMARSYGGTGLGLAITRSLLELMGGSISVTSPGTGRGTTVRLELPRA